ncbi:MAG: response regulator transcription factor [Sphingomonadales bacterium]|nr:MAG: response regulator transcription factor [Sphingomonadales bacterium]
MNATRTPRTCLLIEDHTQTRAWLAGLLRDIFPGLQIVEAGSLRESHAALAALASDCGILWLALIDLGLPDGSGLEILRKLAETMPAAKRVVTTTYGDDAYLLEAIAAGAQGYLLKEEEPERLAETLRRIERDEPPLSPSIARRMLAHFCRIEPPEGAPESGDLTMRETETLSLLARGLTISEAAAQLGLSAHTVAGYSKIIYQKLHVSTRAEATREAVRRGLA